MANATLRLAEGLSLETYIQFASDTVLLNPSGSYFSTADTIGAGGRRLFLGYLPPASDLPPISRAASCRGGRIGGHARMGSSGWRCAGRRRRWAAPNSAPTTCSTIAGCRWSPSAPAASAGGAWPADIGQRALHRVVQLFPRLPSNIKLAGLSVSAPLPAAITFRSEFSWRIGQPLQLDPNEMGLAALSPLVPPGERAARRLRLRAGGDGLPAAGRADLDRQPQPQLPAVLGADQVAATLEGGMTALPWLPGRSALRFAGRGSIPAATRSSPPSARSPYQHQGLRHAPVRRLPPGAAGRLLQCRRRGLALALPGIGARPGRGDAGAAGDLCA